MSFTPSRRSRAATLFEIADWLDPTSRLAALNEPDSIVRTKATSPVVLSRMVVMLSLTESQVAGGPRCRSFDGIRRERILSRAGHILGRPMAAISPYSRQDRSASCAAR